MKEPDNMPAKTESTEVRITVYTTKELNEKFTRYAKTQSRSKTQQIEYMMQEAVKGMPDDAAATDPKPTT